MPVAHGALRTIYLPTAGRRSVVFGGNGPYLTGLPRELDLPPASRGPGVRARWSRQATAYVGAPFAARRGSAEKIASLGSRRIHPY